jgi:hypothetical protein
MDQAYISAIAALAGTIVGGLTSFATAWVTQNAQARSARITNETTKRQELYGRFMDELALLYSHALSTKEVDYAKLVNIFALKGRITLMSTPAVIESADRAMKFIVDLNMGAERNVQEMREMMDQQSADAIGDFAKNCREEFQSLGLL